VHTRIDVRLSSGVMLSCKQPLLAGWERMSDPTTGGIWVWEDQHFHVYIEMYNLKSKVQGFSINASLMLANTTPYCPQSLPRDRPCEPVIVLAGSWNQNPRTVTELWSLVLPAPQTSTLPVSRMCIGIGTSTIGAWPGINILVGRATAGGQVSRSSGQHSPHVAL
jgi:hypothetical protein